jgi:hypothetical protein
MLRGGRYSKAIVRLVRYLVAAHLPHLSKGLVKRSAGRLILAVLSTDRMAARPGILVTDRLAAQPVTRVATMAVDAAILVISR